MNLSSGRRNEYIFWAEVMGTPHDWNHKNVLKIIMIFHDNIQFELVQHPWVFRQIICYNINISLDNLSIVYIKDVNKIYLSQ